MSSKLPFIPEIPNYEYIRNQMREDLKYRLQTRTARTSLGRPLYYRINIQTIMTQECPYHCPFCLERKHPMKGQFDSQRQLAALREVVAEHPDARLTITGGEPSLYPEHVGALLDTFKTNGNFVFASINSAGYSPEINKLPAHINLSVNDYVQPDPRKFPGCTLQTVLPDEKMHTDFLAKFMDDHDDADSFSFRFLSGLQEKNYSVDVWNELRKDKRFHINTFRIGDFFVYATFDYDYKHGRITLGDMYQQTHNDYQDGYSNIIIHPDGRVGTNWR